jgi:hypothetical protein
MPPVSLVICVYKDRDLLERLLQKAVDCHDDLVVIHDGVENAAGLDATGIGVFLRQDPKLAADFARPGQSTEAAKFWKEKTEPARPGSVHELVRNYGGRFFEGPRTFTHETQWPFSWSQCRHDWILLWDSDEFPGEELKKWLVGFRAGAEPDRVSGYRCHWPLWDGQKAVSAKWPSGRLFLINRKRIRYFGMGENRPSPDHEFENLDMILHHQPKRRSYGLHNTVLRKSGNLWRARIANALLGSPADLPCWRWNSDAWPESWEKIRRGPWRTAFAALIMETFRSFRDQWRTERRFFPSAAVSGPIHRAMICLAYWRVRRAAARKAP